MKILQFTPPAAPSKPKGSEPAGRAAGDFASVLKKAAARPTGSAFSPPNGAAGGVISLENHRALQLPTVSDLGQAGRLLGRLDRDIRAATPEALGKLHDLEGLVYIYSKGERV